jgi:hypothetical protein
VPIEPQILTLPSPTMLDLKGIAKAIPTKCETYVGMWYELIRTEQNVGLYPLSVSVCMWLFSVSNDHSLSLLTLK